jgi:protease I
MWGAKMPGKKILMLVGEFTEEYEIFVYQQAMEAVGHIVHVVCPDKKAGQVIATSLHDFEGHQTYTEKPGHNFVLNKTFAEVRPKDYDAVYCAGGRGPEYIRTDKRVQAIVRHFHEEKKPIFTICHGVQILVAVDGVVRGKRVGALGACEPEVALAGGTYVDLSPTEALVDGTMVSAKGWTALAAFIRECLKVLGTEIRHGEKVGEIRPQRSRAPANGARVAS